MSGSKVFVVASSQHGCPDSIPRWSKIFSSLWICLLIILECEGSIPPSGFHGWVPVGEGKLFCTTLPSLRYKSLLSSEVGRDSVGYCLQEWKGGEILGWSRCWSPVWSKKQVESTVTVVQGYVGGLLRLVVEPGWCFVSTFVGERLYVKEVLGVGS